MLALKPLELSDRSWVEPLLAAEASRSAGYTFGTLYLWAPMWRQVAARVLDRLVVRYQSDGTEYFAYPPGKGPLIPVIEAMRDHAEAFGVPLKLIGVTNPQRAALEALLPGCFRFEEDRNGFDYLYSVEKLATLSGKKLHGKRNHCNRFEQDYDWHFEALEPRHFPAVLDLLQEWNKNAPESVSTQAEWEAVCRAVDGYAQLEMEGGMLFVEDTPVAFTMASKGYRSTMDVHFEKAREDYPGSYAMINREFARMVHRKYPQLHYLNREEDMGIPGLRKAKESYHPACMVQKHTAFWQEGEA